MNVLVKFHNGLFILWINKFIGYHNILENALWEQIQQQWLLRVSTGWTVFRNEAILLQGGIGDLSWGIESSWLIFRLYHCKDISNFLRMERCSDGDYAKGFITILHTPETPPVTATAEQDGGKWKLGTTEEAWVRNSASVSSEVSFE